jgi:hypothetical protein
MFRSALIIFVLCTLSCKAQVDSISIGTAKFFIQGPYDWVKDYSNNEAREESGGPNIIYRFSSIDTRLSSSVMGIKFIRRRPIVTETKKSKSKKTQSDTSAFRTMSGFNCYYHNSIGTAKPGTPADYFSYYAHRINDTLDVLLFLSCKLKRSERESFEFKFQLMAESFFKDNSIVLTSLKPYLNYTWNYQQLGSKQQNLQIPVTRDFVKDSTYNGGAGALIGVRYFMEISSLNIIKPTTVSVNIYSYSGGSPKTHCLDSILTVFKGLKSDGDERFRSFCSNLETTKRDTFTHEYFKREGSQRNLKYSYCKDFSIVLSTKEGLEIITFALNIYELDAMEIQYCNDQFMMMCNSAYRINTFSNW